MIGNFTETQVSRLRIAFVNGSSANVKLSKAQLSRVIQSEGILIELLVGLPFESRNRRTNESRNTRTNEISTSINMRYFVNKGKNKLTLSDAPGITLTNSEIKDIMKVFKSLDEFYLKELLHCCH